MFFSIIFLSSCYERQEGCLDELSTNFSIAADDACDDCCTYPTIGFQLTHMLDDIPYSPDSVIVNDLGQEMKLRQSLFYLSDFKFYTEDSEVLEVNRSSTYEDLDGSSLELKEDHIIIDQNDNFVSIGSVRENGVVDSISCNIGIHHNNIALEEDVLLFTSDSLYENNAYYDMVFYLQVGESLENDISVRIRNVNNNKSFSESVISVEKLKRTSLGLVMFIDYFEVLKNIDIEGIEESAILEDLEFGDSFIKFKE